MENLSPVHHALFLTIIVDDKDNYCPNQFTALLKSAIKLINLKEKENPLFENNNMENVESLKKILLDIYFGYILKKLVEFVAEEPNDYVYPSTPLYIYFRQQRKGENELSLNYNSSRLNSQNILNYYIAYLDLSWQFSYWGFQTMLYDLNCYINPATCGIPYKPRLIIPDLILRLKN